MESILNVCFQLKEFCSVKKEIANQLTFKLAEMESRLVHVGRNMVDTYDERKKVKWKCNNHF